MPDKDTPDDVPLVREPRGREPRGREHGPLLVVHTPKWVSNEVDLWHAQQTGVGPATGEPSHSKTTMQIKHVPDPAALLARADEVFFDCFVVDWESLNACQPPKTVQACDERLVKFAGSAVLADGSTGPAPYAGWGVVIDGKYQTCGSWGKDPDA